MLALQKLPLVVSNDNLRNIPRNKLSSIITLTILVKRVKTTCPMSFEDEFTCRARGGHMTVTSAHRLGRKMYFFQRVCAKACVVPTTHVCFLFSDFCLRTQAENRKSESA